MYNLRYLPYALLLAATTSADDSSSSVSQSTQTTGVTELATPTGNYESYTTTFTRTTISSAITTEVFISDIVSGSSTIEITLGATTIFGIATAASNSSTTSPTNSMILLTGSAHSTTAVNGTSNGTATASTAEATNTTPCNNYAEFCARKYSKITEVSAHNSPFVKSGNVASNQALGVTTQLNDGIRLLQGQMHFVGSVPHFCHTSCDVLDAGPITEFLGEVYDWIVDHPYDVVTILLENGPYAKVTNYTSYIEQTGLVKYAYVPPQIPMGINDWPTLASMILTGKRVVFFMDYEANQTAVPWIIDEFSSMFETPFDPTDRDFPCTAQRPPGVTEDSAANLMYLVNHNLNYELSILGNTLLVPNLPLLNVTNGVSGYGSLGVSAANCTAIWNKAPKWLNVDYYNFGLGPNGNGSVFEVAATYNNVSYTRACCGSASSGAERVLKVAGRSAFVVVATVLCAFWMSF